MIHRRDFLRWSSLAGMSFSLPTLEAILGSEKRATPNEKKTVVLIELQGGNDGLNTIVPHADDRYYRARPTLAIARHLVQQADDVVGFAPGLDKLAALFKEGELVVVQGVGMPNPDRSHFTSLDRWHSGSIDDGARLPGWIGRGLDGISSTKASLAGVAFGERAIPRMLQHPERQALCCETLADLVPPEATRKTLASEAVKRMDAVAGTPEERKLAALARELMTRLENVSTRSLSKDAFPATNMGKRLGDALRLVLDDLDVRAIFVRHAGFDTHSNQAATQPQLLSELDGALGAFATALKSRGLSQRVLVVVYSEFGRRVEENGSRGTDHGSAAPSFLLGGGLKGAIVGNAPDLADLDDGDVRATLDYRRVLAQALKHLGHSEPARVLGPGITPLF